MAIWQHDIIFLYGQHWEKIEKKNQRRTWSVDVNKSEKYFETVLKSLFGLNNSIWPLEWPEYK